MEQRLHYVSNNPDDFETIRNFDSAIKTGLSEVQIMNLQQATSSTGVNFGPGCLPEGCTFYFVTLEQEIATVIDNELDLKALIGEVDTPAELHLILQIVTTYLTRRQT